MNAATLSKPEWDRRSVCTKIATDSSVWTESVFWKYYKANHILRHWYYWSQPGRRI